MPSAALPLFRNFCTVLSKRRRRDSVNNREAGKPTHHVVENYELHQQFIIKLRLLKVQLQTDNLIIRARFRQYRASSATVSRRLINYRPIGY
jgi:hypothetical protein